MKIETLEFAGLRSALHGMRNPLDSWDKSDNRYTTYVNRYGIETVLDWKIGDADSGLSTKLQKAGPEHCKHMRQIMVWADITAPRYWWMEFDTYRLGVEKNSCSTMHKLMARPLTVGDFERDCFENLDLWQIISHINNVMDQYRAEADPDMKKTLWRGIIQELPQSYLQKRTVMMSYAALRNIYRQREGHKLREWQIFREWVESLPESWMITE